jgi:hypothetical protein
MNNLRENLEYPVREIYRQYERRTTTVNKKSKIKSLYKFIGAVVFAVLTSAVGSLVYELFHKLFTGS